MTLTRKPDDRACDKLLASFTDAAFEIYAPLRCSEPKDFGDFVSMQDVAKKFDEAVASPYNSVSLSHTFVDCLKAESKVPEG